MVARSHRPVSKQQARYRHTAWLEVVCAAAMIYERISIARPLEVWGVYSPQNPVVDPDLPRHVADVFFYVHHDSGNFFTTGLGYETRDTLQRIHVPSYKLNHLNAPWLIEVMTTQGLKFETGKLANTCFMGSRYYVLESANPRIHDLKCAIESVVARGWSQK